jgi:hypothetical protein
LFIARKRFPGRNCRRPCRAAPSIVAAILTPRSQEPAADFDATTQEHKITNDKFSIFNSQYLGSLLFKVSALLRLSFRSLSSFWSFLSLSSPSSFPLLILILILILIPPSLMPLFFHPPHPQKTLKNPSNCCNLRPFAALCSLSPSIAQKIINPQPVSQTLSHLHQSFVTPKFHELSIIDSIDH